MKPLKKICTEYIKIEKELWVETTQRTYCKKKNFFFSVQRSLKGLVLIL